MNRRQFLHMLGGFVAGAAINPINSVVSPSKAAVCPAADCLTLDEINALAFLIHGEYFPEHRVHYRGRALACLGQIRAALGRRRMV